MLSHYSNDKRTVRPPLVGPGGVPEVLANGYAPFADVITAADGSQMVLHFTRPGEWVVPLPTKPPPAPTGMCTLLPGVDCTGGDIRDAGKVASAPACCALCEGMAGCMAWTWNKGYAKDCWVKESCATRSSDPNVVSGVGASPPGPAPAPASAHAFDVYSLDAWGMGAVLLGSVSGTRRCAAAAPPPCACAGTTLHPGPVCLVPPRPSLCQRGRVQTSCSRPATCALWVQPARNRAVGCAWLGANTDRKSVV